MKDKEKLFWSLDYIKHWTYWYYFFSFPYRQAMYIIALDYLYILCLKQVLM